MKSYEPASTRTRPRAAADRTAHEGAARHDPLQASINRSPRMAQQREVMQGFHGVSQRQVGDAKDTAEGAGRSADNRTGMPGQLKSGLESLSGMDLSDVRVHRNSAKPAQLNALAYAQGNDIHLGPGQERHLPHEAWHVVQQRQGRVKPTRQMKGAVPINDDAALEREADVMGARALQQPSGLHALGAGPAGSIATAPAQLRKIGKFGMEAEVLNERFKMSALNEHPEAKLLEDKNIVLEEFSLGTLGREINVTLDNEVSYATRITKERSFTVEFISKPVDVVAGDPGDLLRMAQAWGHAAAFWKTNLAEGRKVIGMVGQAVDWFTKHDHWEAEQFDGYADARNVSAGEEHSRLYWDGPGFFTYIDARTPDPSVSMQVTGGADLLSLDAMNLAIGHVLAGRKAASAADISLALEMRDLGHEDDDKEAWALLKILRDYREQSFAAWTKQLTSAEKPKRYQKEYISFLVRNSLSSVMGAMSETGRDAFIGWVKTYGSGQGGPIKDELGSDPEAPFFSAKATKEPQAETISIAELLVSIVHPHLPLEEQENPKPGDVFTQLDAPLAGFGEITNERPDQLERFGIGHAGEMMRGVNGVIAENRAAKVRPLSEVPGVFLELVDALKNIERGA